MDPERNPTLHEIEVQIAQHLANAAKDVGRAIDLALEGADPVAGLVAADLERLRDKLLRKAGLMLIDEDA